MINQELPQVKTVKLMFVAMEEQQKAMFKMAFKMHNTTNYQVIEQGSGEVPELVIVDGDGAAGLSAWQKAKGDFRNSVVVYFSKSPPAVTAPYLAKPIKFDTLFPSLRNLLQGNGVWIGQGGIQKPAEQAAAQAAQTPGPSKNHDITIPRFDANLGLLGAFRKAAQQQQSSMISVNGQAILAVFPTIQRVRIEVDADQLRRLCGGEGDIAVRALPEGADGQERANATITSTMWQIALWTADGRLVQPINPNTIFRLKCWPNLTRLTELPESMRLSAFLVKTPASINTLYKLMPLDIADILNYVAATYLTDYLEITHQVSETHQTTQQAGTVSRSDSAAAVEKPAEPAPAPKSGGSLLSRFMKKLLNK